MKKFLVLLIFLIANSQLGFAQKNIDDLTIFIKSWGISRHRLGSDYEDFKKIDSLGYYGISKLLNNSNKRKVNKLIKEVISYQTDPQIYPSAQYADQNLNLDISWINSKRITSTNQDNIHNLIQYKPNSQPYTILKNSTELTWELRYYLPKTDNDIANYIFGIGLLWNYVEFFFQQKDQIIVNWSKYLTATLYQLLENPSLSNYEITISEMFGQLHDGHAEASSYSMQKAKGFFRLPIEIRSGIHLENPIVIKTYNINNQPKQLLTGDRILSINGISFQEYYHGNQHTFSGNKMVKIEKVCSNFILSTSEKYINIEVSRDSVQHFFRTLPVHVSDTDVIEESKIYDTTPINFYGDSIAYINLSLTEPDQFCNIYDRIKSYECLILDLRFYPKKILDTLSKYFYPDNFTISEYKQPDFSHPGFIQKSKFDTLGASNPNSYPGIIVPLVNHNTFSQGEYVALALSALNKTHLVGSPTSGTNGNIIVLNLPYNIRGRFSGISINYPDSTPTFSIGLKLDYIMDPNTIFLPGFDPELRKCIEIIQENWILWNIKQ